MEKNKKIKIIISVVVLILIILAVAITVMISVRNQEIQKQKNALSDYVVLINEKNYDEMYNRISEESKSRISPADFVKRNKIII